jgi:methionyl-tRNA formyltransferase
VPELRIIYMGTPEFAVPSLDILVRSGFKVVAVVTSPDRPSGRGLKLHPSPVKEAALAHNIPVLQPEKLKNPDFLAELRSYRANLQIVVAFRMLPEVVWTMPELGTFNLHASLLPQYRGAAPINWAVMNGETETGLTTFFLQHEIDTGDLIMQVTEPIYREDTAGTLYERLMGKGAELVRQTTVAIQDGKVLARPQVLIPEALLRKAPKIFKETCQINFAQTADQVYNFVRGLAPVPSAWAELNGKPYKIHRVVPVAETHLALAGAWRSDEKTYLHVFTPDGYVAVEELQAEGKKKMLIGEFLRGNKL